MEELSNLEQRSVIHLKLNKLIQTRLAKGGDEKLNGSSLIGIFFIARDMMNGGEPMIQEGEEEEKK